MSEDDLICLFAEIRRRPGQEWIGALEDAEGHLKYLRHELARLRELQRKPAARHPREEGQG